MFWKLASLISVSVAFLSLVVWVYLPRNKSRLNDYGSIPLREDLHSRQPVSEGGQQ
ncbi:MAG: cbb3-type cytochrome oxidase subunit 3 [Gammaproteobacteria bacterium]